MADPQLHRRGAGTHELLSLAKLALHAAGHLLHVKGDVDASEGAEEIVRQLVAVAERGTGGDVLLLAWPPTPGTRGLTERWELLAAVEPGAQLGGARTMGTRPYRCPPDCACATLNLHDPGFWGAHGFEAPEGLVPG